VQGRPADRSGLRPEGLPAACALYACYFRATFAQLFHDPSYVTPGQFLGRAVTVRTFGVRCALRSHSSDLEYALKGIDPSVLRWFQPRSGDSVIDVGAHIGLSSIRAAQAGARVLAFEPNPGLFEKVRENLRLNSVTGVELRPAALGPDYGKGRLRVPVIGEVVASRPPKGPPPTGPGLPRAEIEVVVEPLDGVLRERGDRGSVDWLLVDAEGSEVPVLQGAPRTLSRTANALLEVVKGASAEECRHLLARAGLLVVARERASELTEHWWARRDTAPVRLPELIPKFAG